MTSSADVSSLAERIFDRVRSTLAAGQAEYAHDEDNAFRNFESIAERLGLTREQVCLTYKLKHVDGITGWVNGHRSQREDVTGRLLDDIVYSILLWGMAEEGRSEEDCDHREPSGTYLEDAERAYIKRVQDHQRSEEEREANGGEQCGKRSAAGHGFFNVCELRRGHAGRHWDGGASWA